jgi:ribosomal protein L11 methyltransferase
LEIVLDPGVVFGNGLHPTTRDCLRALRQLFKHHRIRKVVDLGTGTGILALAAAKLGAGDVRAIDINPLCVKTARRNVTLNHLNRTIQLSTGSVEGYVHERTDLLTANIHYDMIVSLLENATLSENAWLILSGLMRSHAHAVSDGLLKRGFRIVGQWDHEMTWFTLLARNEGLRGR